MCASHCLKRDTEKLINKLFKTTILKKKTCSMFFSLFKTIRNNICRWLSVHNVRLATALILQSSFSLDHFVYIKNSAAMLACCEGLYYIVIYVLMFLFFLVLNK